MKKFFVGVKGVVRSEHGVLLIKHTNGFWDMPGGRLDDDEDLEQGLLRELNEELPGSKVNFIGKQVGAYRVHKDIVEDISLVLIFYLVDVEMPKDMAISDEHTEYVWVKSFEDIPEPTNIEMKKIIEKALK